MFTSLRDGSWFFHRTADKLAVLHSPGSFSVPATPIQPKSSGPRRTYCASQRLETKYDLPLLEAEYRLEAVAAEPVVAEALGVETGSPLFRIERTSYCVGNQPVDYEQLSYRGDMVRFVTRLARRGKEGE